MIIYFKFRIFFIRINNVFGIKIRFNIYIQPARDVPGTSPEGPLNVQDLQGIFSELLGDQHKNWWFNKKSAF